MIDAQSSPFIQGLALNEAARQRERDRGLGPHMEQQLAWRRLAHGSPWEWVALPVAVALPTVWWTNIFFGLWS